ncbi:MAG TPA: hypothetical protein VK427_16945 [Kofleriaceae bacterium]|nr:hypothetical protein [Kofleriaceae bacterium]
MHDFDAFRHTTMALVLLVGGCSRCDPVRMGDLGGQITLVGVAEEHVSASGPTSLCEQIRVVYHFAIPAPSNAHKPAELLEVARAVGAGRGTYAKSGDRCTFSFKGVPVTSTGWLFADIPRAHWTKSPRGGRPELMPAVISDGVYPVQIQEGQKTTHNLALQLRAGYP